MKAARRPWSMVLRHCLRGCRWPAAAALAAAMAGAWWTSPHLATGQTAAGAMTPWLQVPLLVLAAACAAHGIVLWPVFADRRPGADWVRRLQRGPLHGCGAVVAGALLAQFLVAAPIAAGLLPWLGAPSAARAHWRLSAPSQPLLDPGQPTLAFAGPPGRTLAELQLRPLAALPAGAFVPSRLFVHADGAPLHEHPIVFQQSGETVRLSFPPRRIERLEVALASGTVPLFFPHGSVTLVDAEGIPAVWNSLCAALLSLLPTFVAMAFACLCGSGAAQPVVLAVAGVLLFVQTIGGVGPMAAACRDALRGHWLPATGLFQACVPSLAIGCACMIGAMLLRRRLHR